MKIDRALRYLNKKGITYDIFIIVLLVVALAVMIVLYLKFGTRSAKTEENLFNLTSALK